ncbi:hypothetical protein B0H13DRAFT_1886599 [Mycena leptocephala]|nr:hypothetical protein B0H13DRAFT_1886599 [Mycena leptocephala]
MNGATRRSVQRHRVTRLPSENAVKACLCPIMTRMPSPPGQLQSWVREEQDIRKSNGLAEQLSAPLLRDRGIIRLPPSGPQRSSQTDAAQSSAHLKSWDGFPDGPFRFHFTLQQVEDTSRLAVYWDHGAMGGDSERQQTQHMVVRVCG